MVKREWPLFSQYLLEDHLCQSKWMCIVTSMEFPRVKESWSAWCYSRKGQWFRLTMVHNYSMSSGCFGFRLYTLHYILCCLSLTIVFVLNNEHVLKTEDPFCMPKKDLCKYCICLEENTISDSSIKYWKREGKFDGILFPVRIWIESLPTQTWNSGVSCLSQIYYTAAVRWP